MCTNAMNVHLARPNLKEYLNQKSMVDLHCQLEDFAQNKALPVEMHLLAAVATPIRSNETKFSFQVIY